VTSAWPTLLAILHAAAVVGVAWVLGGWLQGLLSRWLDGRADPTLRAVLVGAVKPIALVVAIPAALDVLGVGISSFIAIISTSGLAIALSLKGSLSNAASGALLLTTRTFAVGDQITAAGISGRVKRVGFFMTEIEGDDGRRFYVTNDQVLAAPITRHAVAGRSRVEVIVRLPRAHANGPALDRLRAAASTVADTTCGPDCIVPLELEDQFLRVAVRIWTAHQNTAEARAALFLALAAATAPPNGAPPPAPPVAPSTGT
jgi:small conductance mechanosensitive channel